MQYVIVPYVKEGIFFFLGQRTVFPISFENTWTDLYAKVPLKPH